METSINEIEQILAEAVGTTAGQNVISATRLPEVFDACLNRVLEGGVPLEGLGTHFTALLATPLSDQPVQSLYRQFLEALGPDTIAFNLRLYQDLITTRGRGKIDPVAQALVRFSEVFTQGGSNERERQLLLAYLLEGCTLAALEELGLLRNVQDDEDRLFILATLQVCMLGQMVKFGTGGEIGPYMRVYLLLDSAERVLAFSQETCCAFTSGLEYLAREVGPGLTIWLNIATTDEGTIRLVQERLGTRFLREWPTRNLLAAQEGGTPSPAR